MLLIDEYTEQYLAKIFYFCLKKTGSEQDAGDLASDISVEIIGALKRGTTPNNFQAWVWTIVRNRWSRWSKEKYYGSPNMEKLSDYEEVLPSDKAVEDSVIQSEYYEQIRRELAFIRSDYRNILVAHYFDEMSVSQISRRFNIPLGTVKTKLQSSRKILKEGMDMTRKFGTRSFKPETIDFCASGNQPSGLPHSAVKRKIPVNILCEANNNPCTIEELSMELGIAVPYMEEEVKLLEESELLKKIDSKKYITSIFISPKECQNEVNELSCSLAEEIYTSIWKLAGQIVVNADTFGIVVEGSGTMDAQMFFAIRIEQQMELAVQPTGIFTKFKRHDGGNWGFMGREKGSECRLPKVGFNNNGSYINELNWDGFQTYDEEFGKKIYVADVPSGYLAFRVLDKISENTDINQLTETEQTELDTLIDKGFCKRTQDGKVLINAVVLQNDSEEKVAEYLKRNKEYLILKDKMSQYFYSVKTIIAKYSVEALQEDFEYYVAMSSELRAILAALWKNEKLYTGNHTQFSIFWSAKG